MQDQRKMAFYELRRGKLALDVQRQFEIAQLKAVEVGRKTSVTLKIEVFPPENKDERFCRLSYKVDTKLPPRESSKFSAELKNGLIVADGNDPIDVIQEELEFPEQANITKIGEKQ